MAEAIERRVRPWDGVIPEEELAIYRKAIIDRVGGQLLAPGNCWTTWKWRIEPTTYLSNSREVNGNVWQSLGR